MSLDLIQYPVLDFSGGITDYILDAQPNQSSELENFLIDPNKKLITAPGSQIYDSSMYQVPDGNVRIGSTFTALTQPELIINSADKIWVPNTSSFLELVGPSSNKAFPSASTSNYAAFSEWNFHVIGVNDSFAAPIKLYKDGSNVWQLRTAGLPDLATSPTCTSSGGTGNSYIYTFLYHYTYTVGSVVFEDFGPTTIVQKTNIGAPNVNNVSITAIPAISNGSTLNYDTSNIKIYIYRTQNNGTIGYKIGEVTNGTTTFNDNISDTTAITGLLLYTNAGVLDNDPPPPSKYVTTVNNCTYYGHVSESGQVQKNRVRQSVQDDPDSCPTSNYIDVIDEVTGLSSYTDSPLIFTKNHVFRVNGQYNELGQGQVGVEDITKTIGCVSHNSIVQTRVGVFWAGNDGFYWTDGFNYKKISDSINERYKTITSTASRAARIYGTYDTKDNRVIWACSLDTSNTDNDAFVVLDLRWGIRDASTFTTRVNGTSFSPTAITFYNKQLIRADRRGYLLKHDVTYLTDPEIDTTKVPSLWATVGIKPLYESTSFNFGYPQVRKWVPKILLTLQNKTNVSVQIQSVNDNGSASTDLKEIRFRGDLVWGDAGILWGNADIKWNYINIIEEMRRFIASTLRCSYKQVIITQAFTNIYNSDSVGLASVDTAANTMTLLTGTLPADVKNYYVSFESDGYVLNYQITSRDSATQLSYLDPSNTVVTSSSSKWLIRGYPKGEVFDILSYVIYFAPLTDQSYKTWRNEQDSDGSNT